MFRWDGLGGLDRHVVGHAPWPNAGWKPATSRSKPPSVLAGTAGLVAPHPRIPALYGENMSGLHQVESMLARVWPPPAWGDVTVLVAVSGGADSVALLRAMAALKVSGRGRLCAAHLNHQLRGRQADEDEAFVVDLCRQLDVPCEVGRAAVEQMAATSGDGVEAAARGARYHFFRQTAARLGARYVVTAHTADDQAETILHRVIRGTGISGLSGMARARPLGVGCTLIRPLLTFRRSRLLEYLEDLAQPYRCDPSNQDTRLTRNRIRHQLLPRLAEDFNPGVVDALLRLGTLAGEAHGVIDALVQDLREQSVTEDDCAAVRIEVAPLADRPRYVIRELLIATWSAQDWPLQAMGFSEWDQLAEMISPGTGPGGTPPPKRQFPGNVTAERLQGVLRLQRHVS